MTSLSGVLLGASTFTYLPDGHSRESFRVSANMFHSYMEKKLLIPKERILDLFNSPENVADQDERLAFFLEEQEHRGIILYYVGHGGFAASGDQYYLALHSTHPQRDGITSYTTAQLAKTLDKHIAKNPVFLIVDACFSAATVKDFMDATGDGLITGLSNQITSGLPHSGAALLCAASPDLPAKSLEENEPTAFTKCLMKALDQGSSTNQALLSFQDLAALTQEQIRSLSIGGVPLPQLHSPRQTEGDVSRTPLFPNPRSVKDNTPAVHPRALQVFATELRLREKSLRRLDTSRLQSLVALGDAMLESQANHTSIDSICEELLSSETEDPFIIAAPPKSGKTLLAAIIALALAARKKRPQYLDLTLALLAGPTLDVERLRDQKLKEFRGLARDIVTINNSSDVEIVILDGLNPSSAHFEIFESFEQTLRDKRHVCVEFVTTISPNNLPSDYHPDIVLETPNLDAEHTPRLIDAFLKAKSALLSNNDAPPDREMLVQQLQHVGSTTCSIFLLSIADDWLRQNTSLGSEYEIAKQHTDFFIQRSVRRSGMRQHICSKAKQRAFQAFYRIGDHYSRGREKNKENEISFSRFVSDSLALHHPLIRNYLVAQFVLDQLCEFGRHGEARPAACEVLNCVYPYFLNRIQRQMLADEDIAASALKGIDVVLSANVNCYYLKAHACYLAGRFKDQLRAPAIQLLENHRGVIDSLALNNGEARLFHRSYFISLAYLGVKSAAHSYIDELMDNERLDIVNRGFHLEYYGDRAYRPEMQLQNVDDLKHCPITYDKLCAQIEADGDNEVAYSIVTFYTLLSLVLHRLAAKEEIPPEVRKRVLELVSLRVRSAFLGPRVSAYARMTLKALKDYQFRPSNFLFDMNGIKEQKRMGWVERGIDDAESVADHSYGAYLLGLLLLPPSLDENESYDRQHILNMILIHDLAESTIGDFTPKSGDRDKKEKLEREFFDEIGSLGSFPNFAPMGPVRELFLEFEGGATYNAKVARDLDRLENLITLKKYLAMGLSVSDSNEWSEDLQESVITDPGKAILKVILEH